MDSFIFGVSLDDFVTDLREQVIHDHRDVLALSDQMPRNGEGAIRGGGEGGGRGGGDNVHNEAAAAVDIIRTSHPLLSYVFVGFNCFLFQGNVEQNAQNGQAARGRLIKKLVFEELIRRLLARKILVSIRFKDHRYLLFFFEHLLHNVKGD